MEGEDTGGRRQEEVQDIRKEGEPGTYRPTQKVSKGKGGGKKRKKTQRAKERG